jgi:hypothetical protein
MCVCVHVSVCVCVCVCVVRCAIMLQRERGFGERQTNVALGVAGRDSVPFIPRIPTDLKVCVHADVPTKAQNAASRGHEPATNVPKKREVAPPRHAPAHVTDTFRHRVRLWRERERESESGGLLEHNLCLSRNDSILGR